MEAFKLSKQDIDFVSRRNFQILEALRVPV